MTTKKLFSGNIIFWKLRLLLRLSIEIIDAKGSWILFSTSPACIRAPTPTTSMSISLCDIFRNTKHFVTAEMWKDNKQPIQTRPVEHQITSGLLFKYMLWLVFAPRCCAEHDLRWIEMQGSWEDAQHCLSLTFPGDLGGTLGINCFTLGINCNCIF